MRSSRLLVALLLATIVVSILVVSARSTSSVRQQQPVIRETVVQQESQAVKRKRHSLALSIATNRRLTWRCQDALGNKRTAASVSVWALPRSVAYRSFVNDKWENRGLSCLDRLEILKIPSTGDWGVAVALVQRIYPGTASWLLACSSGEGGHGKFVMNHQGSGAGGPMQFMQSTFYAYQARAFADAREKGFIVDREYQSWYHPLGQALTAAYMRQIGISRYHWDPRVDWKCR